MTSSKYLDLLSPLVFPIKSTTFSLHYHALSFFLPCPYHCPLLYKIQPFMNESKLVIEMMFAFVWLYLASINITRKHRIFFSIFYTLFQYVFISFPKHTGPESCIWIVQNMLKLLAWIFIFS